MIIILILDKLAVALAFVRSNPGDSVSSQLAGRVIQFTAGEGNPEEVHSANKREDPDK